MCEPLGYADDVEIVSNDVRYGAVIEFFSFKNIKGFRGLTMAEICTRADLSQAWTAVSTMLGIIRMT